MVFRDISSAALTGVAFAGLAAMFALSYVVTDWLIPRTLLTFAWVTAFSLLAWARLDETAREAHKFAWLYGGGLGMLVLLLGAVGLIWSPGAWSLLAPRVIGLAPAAADMPEPLGGFVVGLLACAIAQVIGYALVWSAWWLRRR